MSIPTDITYTGVSSNYDTNPVNSRNFAIHLGTSERVNFAIDDIKNQMLDQGWTLDEPYYATTTWSVPLMIGTSISGFSQIVNNWYGWQLVFYMPPEEDPTGLPGSVFGTFKYGMATFPTDTQFELLFYLTQAMSDLSPIPWSISGLGDTVTISGNLIIPGPLFNDNE